MRPKKWPNQVAFMLLYATPPQKKKTSKFEGNCQDREMFETGLPGLAGKEFQQSLGLGSNLIKKFQGLFTQTSWPLMPSLLIRVSFYLLV